MYICIPLGYNFLINVFMNDLVLYDAAVKVIKTAILQGQYEAAKDVNRVQLVLYFLLVNTYLSTRAIVVGEREH